MERVTDMRRALKKLGHAEIKVETSLELRVMLRAAGGRAKMGSFSLVN